MTQQTFALVAGGAVTSVVECPDGLDPAAVFGGAGYLACPATVQPGWTWNGTSFARSVAGPPTQAQLVARAVEKQLALRDGGIKVNVGSASTPDLIDVASDADGRDMVAGNVQYVGLCAQAQQAAPTFNWINNSVGATPGTSVVLSAAQMMSVGLTLRAFVQATYDALGAVNAEIAGGSIKTFADIDAASWPATSY